MDAARDPQSLFRQSLKDLDDRLLRGEPFSGHERNCVFLNTGTTRWAGVSHVSGFDFDDDNRALAATDWDGDGDVDLWVANRTAPMVRFLRNDTPRAGDFLTLTLRQDAGNRYAIGARVTVKLKSGVILLREVRAGDSYLSQSSQRLHFGLGPGEEISSVAVRWPNGPEETFTGVLPNASWLLRKGAAAAAAVPARAGVTVLPAASLPLPPGELPAAVPLARTIPVPRLDFTDLSGNARQLAEFKGQPVLVSLVSGNYEACAKQFTAWQPHLDDLRQSGLRILAAGMDDAKETRALLASLPEVIDRGLLVPNTRERIEFLYNQPFEIRLSLAAPAALLLDSNLRLLSVYRGPATLDRILADARRSTLSAAAQESSALPFAGVWFRNPPPSAPLEMLSVLLRQSDWPAAHDYMMANREEFRRSPRHPAAAKVAADAFIARNLTTLALPHYEDALKDYPDDPLLLNNLAYCLLQSSVPSNLTAALSHASRANDLTARKDPALLDTLARIQLAAGNKSAAAATVRAALSIPHASPEVRKGLEELRIRLRSTP